MEQLHLTARFKIKAGKSETFRKIAAKCIDAVREKEMNAGCTRYEWFYNSDDTICDALETYANADAFFAHMGNVGPLLQEIFAVSEFSANLYGSPPEALKKALEGMDVTYLAYEAGM